MRVANVRFSGQILPALKEKNGSHDTFEFRPDVILAFGIQKGWGNAKIVIFGIKFRRHLQCLLSVVEVSHRRRAQSFE